MKNIAYFTICSRNYLAYALTLYHSFTRAGVAGEFYCFLVDEPEGTEDLPFPVIACETMNIPGFWDMAFRYNVMEFNTAVKPFCIDWLFDKQGASHAVYLDPDIYVVRPLSHVEEALDAGADIVLTPHALAPLDDGGDPDDVRLMRTGAYNLGFGAFANTPESRRLVTWWGEQLRTKCLVDLENGLFVDQKFMDLAPCYVSEANILHHPGYNVAYWNLPHRDVSADNGWQVNGEPLHFFHFSGVVPGDYGVFSKHQDRYSASTIGPLKALLTEYLDQLATHGHDDWKTIPYAYNFFTDGTKIADPMRKVYGRDNPYPLTGGKDELFAPDPKRFNARSRDAERYGCRVGLTKLMYEIWLSRDDLRQAFDLNADQGRTAFLNWYLSSAPKELGLIDAYLEPARDALSSHGQGGGKKLAAANQPNPGGTSVRASASRAILSYAHMLRPIYRRIPIELRQRVVQALLKEGYSAPPVHDDRLAPPDAAATPQPEGLNMFGYFRTESGLGQGARLAYEALKTTDVMPSRITLRTQAFRDAIADTETSIAPPVRRRINLFHINADEMLAISRRVHESYYADSYNIGYWAWELEKFPHAWSGALDLVDEVWTPSRFVRDSITPLTEKPVHVVPHPLKERAVSAEEVAKCRDELGVGEKDFLVLTVFDLNSYMDRKNPLGAIQAFKQAFPEEQNVRLLLKFHGHSALSAQRKRLMQAVQDDPRLQLMDDVLTERAMSTLQSAADAFLSLHRCEGFGLNLAECMLKAKPVIATGYSGNMDFMSPDNSLLVDFDLTAVKKGQYPYAEDQVWADPDLRHAATLLSAVHKEPDAYRALADKARKTIIEGYSPEVIGRRMADRISEIRASIS